MFNKTSIAKQSDCVRLSQPKQALKPEKYDNTKNILSPFVFQEAFGAYTVSIAGPDLTYIYVRLSHFITLTKKNAVLMKKAINMAENYHLHGLRFVLVNLNSVWRSASANASFGKKLTLSCRSCAGKTNDRQDTVNFCKVLGQESIIRKKLKKKKKRSKKRTDPTLQGFLLFCFHYQQLSNL